LGDRPNTGMLRFASDPLAGDLGAMALAVATLIVPLAVGIGLGLLVARARRRRLRSWPSAVLSFALPVVAALLAPINVVGFWDVLLAAILASTGFFLAAHEAGRVRPAGLLALGISTLLALLIAEAASRLLPAPPVFPPAREARLLLPKGRPMPFSLPATWEALFPERWPALLKDRLRHANRNRPRILHVGDSMVEGTAVAASEHFVSILNEARRDISSINAGIGGTGPDFYYLLARRWAREIDLDAVFFYTLSLGDLADIDKPYAHCPDGPLLSYRGDGVEPRCDEPRFDSAGPRPWLGSPAPYAVRVATRFSVLARHIAHAFHRVATNADWEFGEASTTRRWERYEAIMKAARDDLGARNVRVVVVMMPGRNLLDQGRPCTECLDQEKAILGRLGIPVLDPWDLFLTVTARDGTDRWFVNDPPSDPHLNPAGHALLAEWLLDRLDGVGFPPKDRPW